MNDSKEINLDEYMQIMYIDKFKGKYRGRKTDRITEVAVR